MDTQAQKDFYKRMLNPARRRETEKKGRTPAEEAASDKGRIITSTAFRRLQTKAQVFSLEENAAVRSRLTHTLEVASYGEWIARIIAKHLINDNILDRSSARFFIQTAENSCYLHDIGNPPFGHLGEYAIREWFKDKNTENELKNKWSQPASISPEELDSYYAGFKYFDGNPQGLRMVCKTHWKDDQYGLNLTLPLIASIVKYLGYEPDTKSDSPFRKKAGYYYIDKEIISETWNELGLSVSSEGMPLQRHPINFIMEAADDIAYCLSDIEDALEKGIVDERHFFESLNDNSREFISESIIDYRNLTSCKDANFINFKHRLVGYLVQSAAKSYITNHIDILEGKIPNGILDIDEYSHSIIKNLKNFTRDNVFNSKEAINIELGGYHIIQSLLDKMKKLMVAKPYDFDCLRPDRDSSAKAGDLAIEKRLFRLLPTRQFVAYKHFSDANPERETIYRCQLVVDYISGMTDSHALKVHNMLYGIDVGVF